MSKSIKKTVKVTTVNVYQPDFETATIKLVSSREYVGGLGERLAISRARKELGTNVQVQCIDSQRTYRATLADFLDIAEVVTDEDNTDEDGED